nr:serine/arginine repetitive matrix protein 1-like [Macaca fascicularis]
MMQINLTGFSNGKNAREFVGELWLLLLSAQGNIMGIPSAFLELKKEEIKQRQTEQEKFASMKKQDKDKDKRHREEKESSREKTERSRSPRRCKSPSPRRRSSPVRRDKAQSSLISPSQNQEPESFCSRKEGKTSRAPRTFSEGKRTFSRTGPFY